MRRLYSITYTQVASRNKWFTSLGRVRNLFCAAPHGVYVVQAFLAIIYNRGLIFFCRLFMKTINVIYPEIFVFMISINRQDHFYDDINNNN